MRRGLAALLVLVAAACGRSGEAPPQTASPAKSAAAAPRLDPASYRPEIETLEGALCGSAAPPDPERVSRAAQALAARVAARERAQGSTGAPVELELFSRRVAAPAADDPLLCSEWEKLRDRLFAPALWYATGSSEIVEAVAARTRQLDRGALARVEHALVQLAELARLGELECTQLDAPAAPGAQPAALDSEALERWQVFQRSWGERVDAAVQDLPTADPATPRDMVLALESAALAARELRLAPAGVGSSPTPLRAQWQQHFGAARDALDQARRHLEQLG